MVLNIKSINSFWGKGNVAVLFNTNRLLFTNYFFGRLTKLSLSQQLFILQTPVTLFNTTNYTELSVTLFKITISAKLLVTLSKITNSTELTYNQLTPHIKIPFSAWPQFLHPLIKALTLTCLGLFHPPTSPFNFLSFPFRFPVPSFPILTLFISRFTPKAHTPSKTSHWLPQLQLTENASYLFLASKQSAHCRPVAGSSPSSFFY